MHPPDPRRTPLTGHSLGPGGDTSHGARGWAREERGGRKRWTVGRLDTAQSQTQTKHRDTRIQAKVARSVPCDFFFGCLSSHSPASSVRRITRRALLQNAIRMLFTLTPVCTQHDHRPPSSLPGLSPLQRHFRPASARLRATPGPAPGACLTSSSGGSAQRRTCASARIDALLPRSASELQVCRCVHCGLHLACSVHVFDGTDGLTPSLASGHLEPGCSAIPTGSSGVLLPDVCLPGDSRRLDPD